MEPMFRSPYPRVFQTFVPSCEGYILAKIHKHAYSTSSSHGVKPFVLIYFDVWGLTPEIVDLGFPFLVLFFDDCTRMS